MGLKWAFVLAIMFNVNLLPLFSMLIQSCFRTVLANLFSLSKVTINVGFSFGWVVHILQEDAWNLPGNWLKYAWSNWMFMEKFQKKKHRFCAKKLFTTRLQVYNDYSIARVARTVGKLFDCTRPTHRLETKVLWSGWFVLKHLEASWFRLNGFY